MSFKKILVPYDNSQNSKRALSKALALANLSFGKITLLHVISYHGTVAKIVEPYKETVLQHAENFMAQVQNKASKQKIPVKKEIMYGSPAKKVIDFANQKKFDIIIMGRRGSTKLTGPTLGSVSNAVVQNTKIPVMIVV